MPFDQAVALLPTWVQYWINILGLVLVAGFVVLLFGRETRKAAAIMFVLVGLGGGVVWLLYNQFGMVRLIGLGHVIFWTPAAFYLWRRLRSDPPRQVFAIAMWAMLLTLVAALAFDYLDVIRWLLGERASIV